MQRSYFLFGVTGVQRCYLAGGAGLWLDLGWIATSPSRGDNGLGAKSW